MNDAERQIARDALKRAKKAVRGGNALGRSLNPPISGSAVRQWKVAPPTRAREIARITGVPQHELRPDLYAVENQEAAE
jgi:DNA-binding transcriptional regulator YdaS (Cro superfamily)